jgi:ketosteroid isomerase-like protein
MTTKETVRSFYNSAAKKNNNWQKHLAEKVTFSDADKNTYCEGKETFIKLFGNVLPTMNAIKVKQLIAEGNTVCAIVSYGYTNKKGETFNQDAAEIWKIKDGKLISLTIYLDMTALWKFLGR